VETAAKLHAEQVERERVQREMAAARRMQELFLPGEIPDVPGYDLWGTNISSLAVSGDYFDLIDLGADGPLLLAIADVSGKGLPASLLMSNVQAGLHSQAIERPFDLARTVANLNRLVCENTDEATFVTLFLAELDKGSGRLRYVRAGHDYPLLLGADGTLGRLEAGGLFIGMMPGMAYEVHETRLGAGDALCLYTDGVTEARSPGDEEFGLARLGETLLAHIGRGAPAAGEALVAAVRAFSGLDRQADDVTVVVLKRDAAT
jgi:sigma-B regulation protein RsbU (phosphoserine phosphatase)